MMKDLIFETVDLSVEFPPSSSIFKKGKPIQALKDVSFKQNNATSIGIIGESGSGKTTLIRTLMGLQKPSSGQVLFEGIPLGQVLKSNPTQFLQKVQIVFQDPKSSFNPKRKIAPQLELPLKRLTKLDSNERKRRIRETLEKVRLNPDVVLDQYPRSFSGGQAQRIAIARALLTQPKVIILDEAVSALDVSVQATVLNLLKELRKDTNCHYLFVGHDIAAVEYLCPYLIVMRKGQIIESGPRKTIIQSPQQPYTKQLIDSIFEI